MCVCGCINFRWRDECKDCSRNSAYGSLKRLKEEDFQATQLLIGLMMKAWFEDRLLHISGIVGQYSATQVRFSIYFFFFFKENFFF